MSKSYLYAIWVGEGKAPSSVSRGNHYEVHEINCVKGESEEDTVCAYVWELRKDFAEGYDRFFDAPEREDHTDEEYEEEYDTAWYEFVEEFANARAVVFDPKNKDHAMLHGAKAHVDANTRYKAEHDAATARISSLQFRIQKLNDHIASLTKERHAMQVEFFELQKTTLALENLMKED